MVEKQPEKIQKQLLFIGFQPEREQKQQEKIQKQLLSVGFQPEKEQKQPEKIQKQLLSVGKENIKKKCCQLFSNINHLKIIGL